MNDCKEKRLRGLEKFLIGSLRSVFQNGRLSSLAQGLPGTLPGISERKKWLVSVSSSWQIGLSILDKLGEIENDQIKYQFRPRMTPREEKLADWQKQCQGVSSSWSILWEGCFRITDNLPKTAPSPMTHVWRMPISNEGDTTYLVYSLRKKCVKVPGLIFCAWQFPH